MHNLPLTQTKIGQIVLTNMRDVNDVGYLDEDHSVLHWEVIGKDLPSIKMIQFGIKTNEKNT